MQDRLGLGCRIMGYVTQLFERFASSGDIAWVVDFLGENSKKSNKFKQ